MKRFSVLFLTALLCALPVPSTASDSDAKKTLAKLENKFFQHTYDNDSVEQRTKRLEQLVLGAASSGDVEARIDKLAEVTGAAQTEANELSPDATQPQPPAQPQTAEQPQPQPQAADDDGNQQYPHIDALETTLLGKTYGGQPLAARLARMESRVFGAPSNADDLSARTDALDQYAATHYPQSTASGATAGNGDSASGDQGSYPRITALETAILGKTYNGQALTDRLNRLEVAAFGKASSSDDLGGRADALEQYANKKYHKQFAAAQQQVEGGQTASGSGDAQSAASHMRSKQMLAMAANTILGLASMASPIGFGGFGPGALGMMPPQRDPAKPDDDSSQKQDDPAVSAATPPPANARLITKVGWCEMQLFGKTCSDMHLEDRLKQISAELNYNTGKSGLALMDHVGDMIKLVQLRNHSPTPVSSTTTTQTH